MPEPDDLVAEQIRYYRERAAEYDRMLDREGRYELDGLKTAADDPDTRELAIAERALGVFNPTGDVLELACGPGWWTKRLARTARSVTGLDASPEMLAVNRARVTAPHVRLINSDLFGWTPDRQYDVVFFSFWLSHVPRDRFEEFWALVRRSLTQTGRVFFIDERKPDVLDGHEQALDDARGTAHRWLEDGRKYRMVKVYYEPVELEALLVGLGWDAHVEASGRRIYYGVAMPQPG
jgi:SAM-dependent methyltransferase